MSKAKLFCDFDGCIVDSVTAFTQVYSDRYMYHRYFKIPKPCMVEKWNFSDECGLLKNDEEVMDIFADPKFFEYLQPFPNVIEVLLKLQRYYQLIIVSIGSYKNISLKCGYIQKHFPFVDDFIGITNKNCDMDKSVINMSGTNSKKNVFLDDNANNLFSQDLSRNLVRYCYGGDRLTEWNSEWLSMRGRWVKNWLEVEKELLNFEYLKR